MKPLKKALSVLIALLLSAVLLFSGWQVLSALRAYQQERSVKEAMKAYKPKDAVSDTDSFYSPELAAAKALNPDVAGWLCIPGTGVDYAFVQTGNNSDYLRRDLQGEYALGGTVFLDCRNAPDCADAKTILYGHNLKNGGMFADLEHYRDAGFMRQNPAGYLYLEDARHTFTIFACMETGPDDTQIYGLPVDSAKLETALAYLEKNALAFEPVAWEENHRLLILSTCADDAGARRLVVAARIEMNA